MSDKEGEENNTNAQQSKGTQVGELNESNFLLALHKQMLKVTKKYDKLIEEVDQLKKQHKAETEWLKQMIIQIGSYSHALVPSAIPRHDAKASAWSQERTNNDNYATKTRTGKINFAKLPKVIESVSEITTLSPTSCNKTLNFSFGPGHADHKLHLVFHCKSCNDSKNCYYTLKMATVNTETENMVTIDKCDYFIHICSVRDGKRTDDQRWLQIATKSKTIKISNCSKAHKTTLRMTTDSIEIDLNQSFCDALVNDDASHQLSIIVSMSLFLYESLTSDDSSPTPAAATQHESRTAKLLDFKSQMNSTVKIIGPKYVEGQTSITERTLLDSGSPIFNTDFKSARPLYRPHIYFSLSQKAIDAFSNWVYGMDTTVFADDIQLNMEVLLFAQDFWICDLIQFCIDNICKILWKNFTLGLLVQVWQFEEKHMIRNLDASLREVIKTKVKINFDIEGCLPWKK